MRETGGVTDMGVWEERAQVRAVNLKRRDLFKDMETCEDNINMD
jgi:hypothetical protein